MCHGHRIREEGVGWGPRGAPCRQVPDGVRVIFLWEGLQCLPRGRHMVHIRMAYHALHTTESAFKALNHKEMYAKCPYYVRVVVLYMQNGAKHARR